MENLNNKQNWMRAVMIGSFSAAVFLYITGRRPAAMALAGIGMATLAAEHPERFEELWHNAPNYLDQGTRLLNGVGQFIDKLGEQGSKFQNIRSHERPTYHA
jgi:hypothetical protein